MVWLVERIAWWAYACIFAFNPTPPTYAPTQHTAPLLPPHTHPCCRFNTHNSLLDVLTHSYEFKYLLEHRSGYLEWEGGGNRTFTVPKTAAEIAVEGRWGATEVRQLVVTARGC